MMVGIDQWLAAIGTFNCHKRVTRCVSFSNSVNSSHFLSMMLYYVVSGTNSYSFLLFFFAIVILNRIQDQRD